MQTEAEHLIERVARTLYERDREGWLNKNPNDFFLTWDDVALEAFKDQWRDEARAALTSANVEALVEALRSWEVLAANVEGLVEALRAWEAWEAKLLLDGRAWLTDDGCLIPQDLFDEYVCGPQSLRASALAHPKEPTQ